MTRTGISRIVLFLGFGAGLSFGLPAYSAGNIEQGARAARACMACHSFAPGHHMTGPSLADVWGRKAGTAEDFGRYSEALRHAQIVWTRRNLDAWLKDPQAVIPGNGMAFAGIADASARADLLAYLEAVSERHVAVPNRALPNLKLADTAAQVSAIRHCGDAYRVMTADRKVHTLWEFDLRLKTDGSPDGPLAGKPVIVGTGMQGDRAAVVFARPDEIPAFIRTECP